MAKLTLADLANLNNPSSAVTSINANNALLETALENTLSRDGTSPNAMGANLDMDGHFILNCPSVLSGSATSFSKSLAANATTLEEDGIIYRITTESLSTAAGASQDFTLTKPGDAFPSGSLFFVQYSGGSNTRRRLGFRTALSGQDVIVTVDNHEPTNAFNGTLLFYLFILSAAAD